MKTILMLMQLEEMTIQKLQNLIHGMLIGLEINKPTNQNGRPKWTCQHRLTQTHGVFFGWQLAILEQESILSILSKNKQTCPTKGAI